MATPGTLLHRIIDGLSRPRTASILAALELAVLGSVNGFDFPLSVPFVRRLTGHAYLDMCGFCSAAVVRSELQGLGEQGRTFQALLLLTIDVLIPMLSCLAGASVLALLTRSWRARDHRIGWLLALPVLAMVLDFAENGTIAALLIGYPAEAPILAGLEGLLSGLKFAAYASVVVAIFVVALLRAVERRRAVGAR